MRLKLLSKSLPGSGFFPLNGWALLTLTLSGLILVPVLTVLLSLFADERQVWEHLADTVLGLYVRNSLVMMAGVAAGVILVGRKAVQYFQRRSAPIAKTYVNLSQIPTAAEAAQIGDQLLSAFLSEKVDKVELLYTRFVSLISSRPVVQSLLPLDPSRLATQDDEIFRLLVRGGEFTVERSKVIAAVSAPPQDMIFEQDPVQILDALLPLYLNNQLLRALQEAAASELAARMTAMNNASDNASELIRTLGLAYNKARQAAITQEILEVVAGAEAL